MVAPPQPPTVTPPSRPEPEPEPEPRTAEPALPEGVNQNQDDFIVVQDIVGLFIVAMKNRDIDGLQDISDLSPLQRQLYANIFDQYASLNIDLVHQSLTINKIDGTARARFEITDLVTRDGNPVVTSAGWTRIQIDMARGATGWQKIAIKNFN